jgi:hypothetical protein
LEKEVLKANAPVGAAAEGVSTDVPRFREIKKSQRRIV